MKTRKFEILFTNKDNEFCIIKIINRARKTTGKYNTTYNIEYKTRSSLAGVQTWIDTKNLSNLSIFTDEIQQSEYQPLIKKRSSSRRCST